MEIGLDMSFLITFDMHFGFGFYPICIKKIEIEISPDNTRKFTEESDYNCKLLKQLQIKSVFKYDLEHIIFTKKVTTKENSFFWKIFETLLSNSLSWM